MTERRDQVLMTFFEPDSFAASTFLSRWSSTNGPFFKLRGISIDSYSAVLAGLATADDQTIGRLLRTTRTALGLAPRRHGVTTTGRTAFTTAVRVIDRVP